VYCCYFPFSSRDQVSSSSKLTVEVRGVGLMRRAWALERGLVYTQLTTDHGTVVWASATAHRERFNGRSPGVKTHDSLVCLHKFLLPHIDIC
jgi:hypothetical protein